MAHLYTLAINSSEAPPHDFVRLVIYYEAPPDIYYCLGILNVLTPCAQIAVVIMSLTKEQQCFVQMVLRCDICRPLMQPLLDVHHGHQPSAAPRTHVVLTPGAAHRHRQHRRVRELSRSAKRTLGIGHGLVQLTRHVMVVPATTALDEHLREWLVATSTGGGRRSARAGKA